MRGSALHYFVVWIVIVTDKRVVVSRPDPHPDPPTHTHNPTGFYTCGTLTDERHSPALDLNHHSKKSKVPPSFKHKVPQMSGFKKVKKKNNKCQCCPSLLTVGSGDIVTTSLLTPTTVKTHLHPYW